MRAKAGSTATTVADVAKAAGVSPAIVSRVINDDQSLRIRPDTRKRVLSAAKSLDYTTAQEISLSLKAGEVVSLSYYRSGSGGPSGYPDGRVIEIEWDGK